MEVDRRKAALMSDDIGHILSEWEFSEDRAVRKIVGDDGKAKLQVRLPLGIEQYEMDGRPDGARPNGYGSFLEYYESRLRAHRVDQSADEDYSLSHGDCRKLADEGLIYYYRYVLFFQIGDYIRTVRDTQRNLRMFDFVSAYAADQSDRIGLEQYRPYIIRMNRVARALLAIESGRYTDATREVDEAVQQIGRLEEIDAPAFSFEKQRSLTILRNMRKELEEKRPRTVGERLEDQLADAVRAENYERAAALRDRLRELERSAEDA